MNNSTSTRKISRKERKDLKILALFTSVYCAAQHLAKRGPIATLPDQLSSLRRYDCCDECAVFLHYAIARRLQCPLDPKPSCKHCPVHCYRPGHREMVREIMRFSGRELIRRGRFDLLWHYLF
jgi:hypothetical protein